MFAMNLKKSNIVMEMMDMLMKNLVKEKYEKIRDKKLSTQIE